MTFSMSDWLFSAFAAILAFVALLEHILTGTPLDAIVERHRARYRDRLRDCRLYGERIYRNGPWAWRGPLTA